MVKKVEDKKEDKIAVTKTVSYSFATGGFSVKFFDNNMVYLQDGTGVGMLLRSDVLRTITDTIDNMEFELMQEAKSVSK